jgi:hypothetical protein
MWAELRSGVRRSETDAADYGTLCTFAAPGKRFSDRFCTTLYLSSGPGATGSTGVPVEGGQGVCGRGGGGGGLIYWEDMAYHCHSLLRDVLQRCCCCCGPSSLGAVRCFLIPLGPLSLSAGRAAGSRTKICDTPRARNSDAQPLRVTMLYCPGAFTCRKHPMQ